MNCSDHRENLELYALKALPAAESGVIRGHLEEGCSSCGAELAAIEETLAAVAFAAPQREAPVTLRGRVLGSVRPSRVLPVRRSFPWKPLGWVAAAAAVTVLFIEEARVNRVRTEMQSLRTVVARQEAILDVLSGPETREVVFGEGASGRVLLHPRRGVLLLARNLPVPPAGRVYQMWIVPRSGAPRPAGLLAAEPPGRAAHFHPAELDLSQVAAVALSVEPPGGSAAPTTTPFLIVGL
ncbi:MAG: anti-sigma factor [Bryobacteraceae bacterium]|nr:anti-sigma factor [Bryobacteraceae bacterium]